MRFSQTAEYALRALAQMAITSDQAPFRTQDISEATAIPSYYLSKIMRKLVEANLLHSRKGHGGGFTFARSLQDIHFSEILRAVDFGVEPASCVFGWGMCNPQDPCPLHPFWSRLKDNFNEWAETYTLEDVRQAGGLQWTMDN